jgi:formylglycine-generating enzyme required for sulfatase activity
MGKFEATQKQYQQAMGTNPSQFIGTDLPVEQVSWDDAQEFCKAASTKGTANVRLPSEAEWEFACRAGTSTNYHSGDTEADLDRAAWYTVNSKDTTHPVGKKEPNVFGLYDMHGNVWESCEDDWHDSYQGAPSDGRACIDAPRGGNLVSRGGSWRSFPGVCRSACRLSNAPEYRGDFFGFRVVLEVSSRTP